MMRSKEWRVYNVMILIELNVVANLRHSKNLYDKMQILEIIDSVVNKETQETRCDTW